MSIRFCLLGLVSWLVGLGVSPAASVWEEVKIGPRSYVTLDSFAQFYRLTVPQIPVDDFFELRGENTVVSLRSNSRDVTINGSRAWLSFSVATDELGRTLVPKADVILMFDPLIRQARAVPARPFKGVIIDPGHGGADKGARTRSGYTEKAATLDTALHLEKILKDEGIPVIMTRRTDVFVSLEERAALSAQQPGYVFLSVHYNSGPIHSHGVETFALSPQGTPSTSSEGVLRTSDKDSQQGNRTNLHNILLTGMIHKEMTKMHSSAGDRGIKRARFVVLRQNYIPATLIEGGFMSNDIDGALISSEAYREKVARAIAKGLKSYVQQVDPAHVWVQGGSAVPQKPAVVRPAPLAPQIPLRKPEEITQPIPPEPAPVPVPAPDVTAPVPPATPDIPPIVEPPPSTEPPAPVVEPLAPAEPVSPAEPSQPNPEPSP